MTKINFFLEKTAKGTFFLGIASINRNRNKNPHLRFSPFKKHIYKLALRHTFVTFAKN